MTDYRAFGGRLRSDLSFPHLPRLEGGGQADWRLTVAPGEPPAADAEAVGEDQVTPGVRVRLLRDAGGAVRLVYDDTGQFRVSSGGRRITWWPAPDVDLRAARVDVLGRVLPMALHLRGLLVLHASAVDTPGGAVGFMGPKGSGKTTLALALHRRGAGVMTDDALAVEIGTEGALAWPGVASLRLRPDAAEHAGLETADAAGGSDGGRTVMELTEEAPRRPRRLAALFLLDPAPPEGAGVDDDGTGRDPGASPPVRRLPLEEAPGALVLVGQAKLGPLLGSEGAPDLLRRAASLADRVPVERLRIPRDLERIGDAARAVLADFAPGRAVEAGR